ncbi:MAG TPA: hypothetical protein PKA55_06885 [Rhodoblastus sp.]|nr:hypothetical protein [Rhodoblastus sp.]
MDLLLTASLFLVLLCAAAIGFVAQRRLHPRHISRETFDSIRLQMGMLITFTALVLGLLTSSAKERYDGFSKLLSDYSADLIELDHRLRVYGPEADALRALLRAYTAAAIADTWPGEPRPSGVYPSVRHAPGASGVESSGLGSLLAEVDLGVQRLAPQDEFHRRIADRLSNRVAETIQTRWRLVLSARSTLSWPFLLILTAWLAIVFGIFALTAPRDELVYVVIVLSALAIASPLYLILNYSGALSGALDLPSISMRAALEHMDRAQ